MRCSRIRVFACSRVRPLCCVSVVFGFSFLVVVVCLKQVASAGGGGGGGGEGVPVQPVSRDGLRVSFGSGSWTTLSVYLSICLVSARVIGMACGLPPPGALICFKFEALWYIMIVPDEKEVSEFSIVYNNGRPVKNTQRRFLVR